MSGLWEVKPTEWPPEKSVAYIKQDTTGRNLVVVYYYGRRTRQVPGGRGRGRVLSVVLMDETLKKVPPNPGHPG